MSSVHVERNQRLKARSCFPHALSVCLGTEFLGEKSRLIRDRDRLCLLKAQFR